MELAGALGVAFVNTASAVGKNRQQGVATYADLITWGQQTGVLSALDGERLSRRAGERPAEAAAVFARAATVRSALRRLFAAMMAERDLPAKDLDIFNSALAEAMPALRVVPGETGRKWGWAGDEDALDRMLWPALFSAAEVLVAVDGQVRQCALKGCSLFFIDRGRKRQRRWCSRTCGNRAKSLRHYYRHGKAERESSMRDRGLWTRSKARTEA